MNIYIDESGGFVRPSQKKHLVSCVCALTVPASRESALFYDFLRLRDSWPHQDIDLKGRCSLDEKQIADVLKLLNFYDLVAEIVGIDMATHTEADVLNFKSRQADCITQHLGPQQQILSLSKG